MALAIFGISNGGLNLVVNLLILMLVVVWLALIVFTYLDAKRRITDPFLIGCATLASFIPYIGTAVYAIVRPPEFLEDAHERELEIEAAQLRVRQLKASSCTACGFPIERSYMRCPDCGHRLKDPCPSCRKPVDPRWSLCPYCEEPLRAQEQKPRRRKSAAPPREKRKAPKGDADRAKRAAPVAEREPARERPPAKEPERKQRPQRSPSREPDPDPRKA